ncbi:MAG TPA: hypothetical protein VLC09_07560, partial [Polyangiaceae bacterium]|nr:hypothetical protein [Polyangiaceae bacterium]
MASFNVRWFPDGKPGKQAPSHGGTDAEWLGCVLADLDVDAIAVQEFKTLPRAQEVLARVLAELDRLSGGSWRAGFDDCPTPATQHVGILYDSRRVRAGAPRVVAELNPHGEKCKDTLRPGYELALTWPGGQALRFVSVHFKSEADARSLGLRDRSFEVLG